MSRRPGILVNSYVEADRGESPNRYSMGVTCEIRCHWPPLATDEQIMEAMQKCWQDAVMAIARERTDGRRR
jgi:hypothetical protein